QYAIRADVVEDLFVPTLGELHVRVGNEKDLRGGEPRRLIAGAIDSGMLLEAADTDIDLGLVQQLGKCRHQVFDTAIGGSVVDNHKFHARARGAGTRDGLDGRRKARLLVARGDCDSDVRAQARSVLLATHRGDRRDRRNRGGSCGGYHAEHAQDGHAAGATAVAVRHCRHAWHLGRRTRRRWTRRLSGRRWWRLIARRRRIDRWRRLETGRWRRLESRRSRRWEDRRDGRRRESGRWRWWRKRAHRRRRETGRRKTRR